MTHIEACQLIAALKKENESNTPEERKFNNEWMRLIYKSWGDAFSRAWKEKMANI